MWIDPKRMPRFTRSVMTSGVGTQKKCWRSQTQFPVNIQNNVWRRIFKIKCVMEGFDMYRVDTYILYSIPLRHNSPQFVTYIFFIRK